MIDLSLYIECTERKRVVSKLMGGPFPEAEVEFYVTASKDQTSRKPPPLTIQTNLETVDESVNESEEPPFNEIRSFESRTTIMKQVNDRVDDNRTLEA